MNMKIGRAALRGSVAPPPAGLATGGERKIVTTIAGATVIVLDDGTVIAIQARPAKVLRSDTEKDEQGRPKYDLTIEMHIANVTPATTGNLPAAMPPLQDGKQSE